MWSLIDMLWWPSYSSQKVNKSGYYGLDIYATADENNKQVDSSLSKNQVPISLTTKDITIKSCEKGLITKECIATHTN